MTGMAHELADLGRLDLTGDVVDLTEAICNVQSVSLDEQRLCDLIETELAALSHLSLTRLGNSLVARTELGRTERVVIAGHIDTVPLNHNLPVTRDEEAKLAEFVHRALKHPFPLRFSYVERVERSPVGKYEEFKSLVT